ncbi:MAG: glycosyltransferase family 4 protein [Xanthomonadales bacterium]|jgi:glycosyltransferase involved in cell wall biosynthesis|nr:glycosyltransferase family 4 protein [Xanthomonadales bacterium]
MKLLLPEFEHGPPGQKLKILVIGSIPPYPGGAEISLGHFIDGFTRKGHAVTCISPASQKLADACTEFDHRHPQYRVHRYSMPDLDLLPYRPDPEFASREKREIEKLFYPIVEQFRPDVIISGRDSYAPIVIPLANGAGLRCIQLLRGSPTAQILGGSYPADLGRVFLEHLQCADQVIAVAEYMASGVRERGIAQAFCIPNAVDTRHFRPAENKVSVLRKLGLPTNAPIILSPSNLLPRKRPFDLLRAAEIALQGRPDLHFIFLGQGTDAEKLALAVDRSPAKDNVHLLGWLDYEEMPGLLNAVDLVVMTSESEGMSRACIETMACAGLLIASDIAPARELVDDGRNGLLFPLGDFRALAERILWSVEHPAEISQIGRQARRDVLNRSYGPIIDRYLSALRKSARAV